MTSTMLVEEKKDDQPRLFSICIPDRTASAIRLTYLNRSIDLVKSVKRSSASYYEIDTFICPPLSKQSTFLEDASKLAKYDGMKWNGYYYSYPLALGLYLKSPKDHNWDQISESRKIPHVESTLISSTSFQSCTLSPRKQKKLASQIWEHRNYLSPKWNRCGCQGLWPTSPQMTNCKLDTDPLDSKQLIGTWRFYYSSCPRLDQCYEMVNQDFTSRLELLISPSGAAFEIEKSTLEQNIVVFLLRGSIANWKMLLKWLETRRHRKKTIAVGAILLGVGVTAAATWRLLYPPSRPRSYYY